MLRKFFAVNSYMIFGLFVIGMSCQKNNPLTPQPAHTSLSIRVNFISTRWVQLSWKNDSTAASRSYLLIRNLKDTVFVGTSLKDSVSIIDSGLVPSSVYSYSLYRIVNGARWDSASVAVRTLDTTKDNYVWEKMTIAGAGGYLNGIWASSPQSIWMCGSIGGRILHLTNRDTQYLNILAVGVYNGCYGTSDSSVYFVGELTIAHYDGHGFDYHVFNGDSLPNYNTTFSSIWVAPDDRELFAVGNNGTIVHRKADGKTWEVQQSGTTLSLASIIGFSSSDIYASGGYSNIEGVLLHYDGISWSTVLHSLNPGTSMNVGAMPCVHGTSGDSLYLVGNGVFHRHDTTWENRTPQNKQLGYMESVYAQAWNHVFVCGDFGFIMHFDGEKWVIYPNFFSLSSTLVFRSSLIVGDEIFIVGSDDNGAYLIHGN